MMVPRYRSAIAASDSLRRSVTAVARAASCSFAALAGESSLALLLANPLREAVATPDIGSCLQGAVSRLEQRRAAAAAEPAVSQGAPRAARPQPFSVPVRLPRAQAAEWLAAESPRSPGDQAQHAATVRPEIASLSPAARPSRWPSRAESTLNAVGPQAPEISALLLHSRPAAPAEASAAAAILAEQAAVDPDYRSVPQSALARWSSRLSVLASASTSVVAASPHDPQLARRLARWAASPDARAPLAADLGAPPPAEVARNAPPQAPLSPAFVPAPPPAEASERAERGASHAAGEGVQARRHALEAFAASWADGEAAAHSDAQPNSAQHAGPAATTQRALDWAPGSASADGRGRRAGSTLLTRAAPPALDPTSAFVGELDGPRRARERERGLVVDATAARRAFSSTGVADSAPEFAPGTDFGGESLDAFEQALERVLVAAARRHGIPLEDV